MSASPGGSSYSSAPSTLGDSNWYADQIPALERDFCSGFACCGHTLADLHELVDHFEEAHAVVDAAGGSIYPRSFVSSRFGGSEHCVPMNDGMDFAPFSSPVLGDLQPRHLTSDIASRITSTLSPVDHPSPLAAWHNVLVTDLDGLPGDSPNFSSELLGLPPSSFINSSQPAPVTTRPPTLPTRTEKKRPRGQAPFKNRRDKLYRCPVRPLSLWPSYLNPNGLKYHMERGTCNVAPNFTRGDPRQSPVHSALSGLPL
ncbi:hypothetical protein BV22DRAFT_1046139 [Leucogyrophana mollusca]|uniref:Uncharacterized protein n=1 Tax=Leucogyrophana mollusca TaxID=85980 RepID=A0ACB8BLD4_9AGAM|nr:hypothetical protein BV22DRAFT_1046139 [Leucogyrophana mollusca]